MCFKPAGNPRNILYEVNLTTWTLVPIGTTPAPAGKTYYKDGDPCLFFHPTTGELLVFNFCSPDPTTGAKAEPVIWQTNIFCPGGAGTEDTVARNAAKAAYDAAIAASTHANQIEAHLHATP